MAHEIEAAAVDGAAAALRRRSRSALAIGAPCANCATPLQGGWCHACGQSSEDFHRSLTRLVAEAFGGLFELDSRLWRTLPDLFLNPARLTRDYLDGHRAPQAPPFRTFLIVVVLVFLAASVGEDTHTRLANPRSGGSALNVDHGAVVSLGGGKAEKAINAWLTARVKKALNNQQAFGAVMATWAQRLAVLALPMSAALLGLMFFWRRGVFMFDHLIFSMHSLSFQGLLLSAMMLLEKWSDWAGLLVVLSPAHLFFHLRGTYGLGTFGALVRMVVLFVGSLLGFVVIMVGLVLIGLYEVGG